MSEKNPQLLIRFKNADLTLFDLEDESQFLSLENRLEFDGKFIRIGNAILLINEIDRLFYFKDGYANAPNSQSYMPKT